jgi:hypothetical protein
MIQIRNLSVSEYVGHSASTFLFILFFRIYVGRLLRSFGTVDVEAALSKQVCKNKITTTWLAGSRKYGILVSCVFGEKSPAFNLTDMAILFAIQRQLCISTIWPEALAPMVLKLTSH